MHHRQFSFDGDCSVFSRVVDQSTEVIEQQAFADMNGDGALDLRDVVGLLRRVVGL